MILYPFPPGSALKCGIAGFDEEKENPPRSCTCSRRALCRLRNLTADICSAKRRAVATRGFCSPYRLPRRMRPPSGATRRSPAAVWRDTCAGCSRSGGTGSGYISRPSGCCSPSHAPSGVGTPLDETAADALTARHPSHFSPELVCRYCFFRDEDGDAHVFLYDTEETCREKLNLLRRLGVRRVFGEIPQT